MAASNSPAEQLITENLDIWTSAIKKRGSQGRGSSNKTELYGIKKLRDLILDLAINGFLVEYAINSKDLESYKKRVINEKKKITEGNVTNKNKLIPNHESIKSMAVKNTWISSRINELFITAQGVQLSKDVQRGDSQPGFKRYLYISDFKHSDNLKYVEDKYPTKEVTLDDLVMANTGSPGEVYYGVEGILSNNLFKISFNNDLFDKDFVYLFFKSPSFVNALSSQIKGAAQQHLGHKLIGSQFIPIPPYKEQLAIVSKVDELMALCDQLEQQTESSLSAHQTLVETLLNTLLNADQNSFDQAWERIAQHFDILFTTEHSIDQLKQTILQLAVMGKLVPQDPNDEPASVLLEKIAAEKEQLIKDKVIKKQKPLPPISEDEKPFELPKGWEWCRLPDIGDLARGKSKHRPRNDPSLYIDGKIPLIQTGDVSRANGVIHTYTALYNETGLAQSRLWPKGTMCITIAANIADTSVLGFDACFPDSVVGYTPFDKAIDVKYFEFFIRTAKSDLEKYAPSTAQKNINLEILSQVLVPLPPKKEISRIVTKIENLITLCDRLKININQSQTTQLHLADAMAEQALNS